MSTWTDKDIANYLTSDERHALRGALCGLSIRSQRIGIAIRASHGDQRRNGRVRKGAVGDYARYLHLAHGMLRGLPYAALEANARRAPGAGRLRAVVDLFGGWWASQRWTVDAITAWLAVPATAEMIAHRESARVDALAKRVARRREPRAA